VTLNVSANELIQYKYIKKFLGSVTWESDPNRELTTPPNETVVLDDVWR
jgi:glucoamylase